MEEKKVCKEHKKENDVIAWYYSFVFWTIFLLFYDIILSHNKK